MAALPDNLDLFRHIRLAEGRLVISFCSECGLVVAASPIEHVLHLAEKLHRCPVYLNYSGA